ncbi:MAG TPA: Holliday junction branch migration protein RuvA [Bacilli bacterium]|nr:Holliday junction branch migration protein RuvA [Bacilli bacterium]
MIYALEGLVTNAQPTKLVLNVNGVFYELLAPNTEGITVGQHIFIYTKQIIREDEHLLIGFKTSEEKDLFEKLISVTGVGPKTALGILTATYPERFWQAIVNEDLAYLKKLPGVGPKGASQIILDLKGKLQTQEKALQSGKYLEVEQGLIQLGFKKRDVTRVLKKVYDEKLNASDLLRVALSEFRK